MAREFAKCKGCGEEIEWALMDGRPHPFDVVPTDKDRGYELVETASSPRMVAIYVKSASELADRLKRETPRLVVSHFSTCPKAKEFRGTGRKGGRS